MTLHRAEAEVGVRELHDRLSEYLERVEAGSEIVVTRRGRPVARLSGLGERPLEALARRGLVRIPAARTRSPRPARVKGARSVSDLVPEQRA
ncbi:MAG: type II toxin-antitoxin system prevent-host-death family antitoxin [Actinobacteria bacterium]|nr:type II toxin-antitoxin system prevent-host-death family antitoxin [Actinomycetota bacterium]